MLLVLYMILGILFVVDTGVVVYHLLVADNNIIFFVAIHIVTFTVLVLAGLKMISARKKMQEVTNHCGRHKQIIDLLFKHTPMSMIVVSSDFKIKFVNDKILGVIGAKFEDIVGRNCYDILGSGSVCDKCPVKQVLLTGQVSLSEKKAIMKKGKATYIQQIFIPLFNENKTIDQILEIVMDITDKVKAEIENSEVEIQTVTALSKLIENRDLSTKEHSVGVRNLAVKIGQKLNFTLEQLEELSIAATLHDIGKIGIPENVLNKPDKLTEDEYELIKEHSKIGYEALNEINRLKNVAKYILHHHEKYDGTGYPSQQVGCEIPLASRVLAIADVYEAITSDRVYRKAMTKEQGIEIMANGKGSHFDPELLKIFFAILEEDKEIKK